MTAAAGATADTQRAPPEAVSPAPMVPTPGVMPATFPRAWFERDPVDLAQALIGQYVTRVLEDTVLVGRIEETEAYAGPEDRASHSRAGHTRRTAPMYGPAGHAYVYLVYGMHHCLNVVAQKEGVPAAVLIRALSPISGVAAMRRARGEPSVPDTRLLAGPALACAGLSIDLSLDGHDLTLGNTLWIGPGPTGSSPGSLIRGPRIGVAYAGPDWAQRPWRFGLRDSESLSRAFPGSPGAAHSQG